jgi:HEAT repeat protein
MDHLVDETSFTTLVRLLDDPNPQVRVEACHALACDGCKNNSCRPDARTVLPRVIALLLHDPDRHVRTYAAEVVGRWVHTHTEAEAALICARDRDPAPGVRKKAGWYAPGGTIHRKTVPRPVR